MSDVAVSNSPNAGASSATRRSTRVSKKVSLSVSGRNKIENTLLETTSTVAMNCHGCLYASRYEYQSGSWITLEVPSQPGNGKSHPVRAQVRFIRLPRSPHELYQVGVELETPANVWGVQSPPQDWLRYPNSLSAAAGGAAEVQAGSGIPVRHATPAAQASVTPARPVRVMISPEQLLQALDGKLQPLAEKMVASALTEKLKAALDQAATTVESFTQASLRQIEENCAQTSEKFMAATREEFHGRLQEEIVKADGHLRKQVEVFLALGQETAERLERSALEVKPVLADVQGFMQEAANELRERFSAGLREIADRTGKEFDGETARVTDRQLARLAEKAQGTASEAAMRLEARAAGARSQLETAAGSALAEFHVMARNEIEQFINETRNSVQSSLASFVDEARAAWENRQRASQEERVHSSEKEIENFRQRLETILNSSMVAAVSAIQEQSKTLLESLAKGAATGAGETNPEAPSV